MHWTHGMGWHGGWLMGGMWLIWIALFVVLALAVGKTLASTRRSNSPTLRNDGPSPEEILKQRYARGELGPDEYEATLADLRK